MSERQFRTIIEPFRIHSIEPLRLTTATERRRHGPRDLLCVAKLRLVH